MDDELAYLSAAELSGLIRQRQLSPVQLVQSTLARIERSQPVFNAFITVCAEERSGRTRDAEQALKRGDALPLLHGVPFSVKDLVSTEGCAHDLRLSDLRASRPHGRCCRGRTAESCRRDPDRENDDARIRTEGPHRGAAVWSYAQPLARRSNSGRLQRRCRGGDRRRPRPDRSGDRRRRLNAHSRSLQRRGRLQAKPGRGAGRFGAGCVRQHLLCHTHEQNGHGHRADAGRDDGSSP